MSKYLENSKKINAIFDKNLKTMDSTTFNRWLCLAFGSMSMCISDEKIDIVLEVIGGK